MDWFCLINGEQMGPMGQEELDALLRKGMLKSDDYVWNASFGATWKLAKDVPELRATPPPAAATQAEVVYAQSVFKTPLSGVSGKRPLFAMAVSQAWAHMRQTLFKPFNLALWFSIGFGFWLTFLSVPNFAGPSMTNEEVEKMQTHLQAQIAANPNGMADSILHVCQTLLDRALDRTAFEWVGVGMLTLIFALIMGWLNARGVFMVLHRWHHPNDTIARSWKAGDDGLGNSLFLFRLVTNIAGLLLTVLACVGACQHVAFRSLGRQLLHGGILPMEQFWPVFMWVNVVMLAIAIWGTVVMLLNDFVTPVMYWRRVGVMAAWRVTWEFCNQQPIPVLIYFLVLPLLWIVAGLAIMLACFCTCCCGCVLMALPFLNAVALLPVTFFFRGLGICFLRQWRPDLEHD
jgi:hypothetical protein